MPADAQLLDQRNRCFAEYDQGRSTQSDTLVRFYRLLADASTDRVALSLCDGLPDWFQNRLVEALNALADHDYYVRWTSMGDPRSAEQRQREFLRVQQTLLRIAPEIVQRLTKKDV